MDNLGHHKKKREKTGGRQKGTPNKRNTILEEAFKKVVTRERAEKLLAIAVQSAAEGKPGLLLGLMPYCLQEMPKVVEHGGELPVKFTLNLNP